MANCTRCGRQLPPLSFKKICQWCVQHEAAQRGEESGEEKQVVLPAPWVRRSESTITLTQVLFGANVAIFIAMVAASGSIEAFPGKILGNFGANWGPFTLSGDWWRLITYMFVHADIFHIGFNMWCLWSLGSLCESLYGRWTFGAIYLIAGVTGGLARLAWDPTVPSVGASGAIFGLAGALIASLYLGEFTMPRFAIESNLRSLLFFAGFNILFGISPIGDWFGIHVDNACHIGGLVSGLILGALIARLAPQVDAPLRRASVVGVVVVAIFGAWLGVRQWRGTPMRMAKAFEEMSESKGDSVARLQAIIREQPNLVPAHFQLAQVYFNRRQFPDAEAEFKRVLDLEPKSTPARFDLGLTYLNEKRYDDASAAFRQMLSQDSSNGDGHYGLGLALADQGKDQEAIEEFKAAAAKGSQMSGLYYEMGVTYGRLKVYDDAIAAFLKEKDENGDDVDLESALADAYQAKGMTQKAEEARNRATLLKSEHGQP